MTNTSAWAQLCGPANARDPPGQGPNPEPGGYPTLGALPCGGLVQGCDDMEVLASARRFSVGRDGAGPGAGSFQPSIISVSGIQTR